MTRHSQRLDPELPASADTDRQARESAARALQILQSSGADGREQIFESQLNEALDPLRLRPALGVRCGRCDHGMGWAALHPQGAYVVSSNRRQPPHLRRGGIHNLKDVTQPTGSMRRFPGWVEDAAAGRGSVSPTGERPEVFSGLNERRTHKCPKCSASYTNTNTTLLRLLLRAMERGYGEIRLGLDPT